MSSFSATAASLGITTMVLPLSRDSARDRSITSLEIPAPSLFSPTPSWRSVSGVRDS